MRKDIFEKTLAKLEDENNELRTLLTYIRQLLIEDRLPAVILHLLKTKLADINERRSLW